MVFAVFLCKKILSLACTFSPGAHLISFYVLYVTLRMSPGGFSWLKPDPMSAENEPRAAFS